MNRNNQKVISTYEIVTKYLRIGYGVRRRVFCNLCKCSNHALAKSCVSVCKNRSHSHQLSRSLCVRRLCVQHVWSYVALASAGVYKTFKFTSYCWHAALISAAVTYMAQTETITRFLHVCKSLHNFGADFLSFVVASQCPWLERAACIWHTWFHQNLSESIRICQNLSESVCSLSSSIMIFLQLRRGRVW